MGAFAAAVGAGVLTFTEAVAAVKLRGENMARACASGHWAMARAVSRCSDFAVASHGPLQRETARVVAQYLSTIPHRPQCAAYMTNVGARRVRYDSAAVLDDLADAVAHPVRWFDIMRLLPELGVRATIEMPLGHVLSRLVTHDAGSERIQRYRR